MYCVRLLIEPTTRRWVLGKVVCACAQTDEASTAVARASLANIGISSGGAKAASWGLRRSVTSIEPGAWVMQKSGRAWASAACGVTPQAQNTGNSSAISSTASP